MHTDRSVLFVTEMVLNYVGVLKLQYSFSFAKDRVKNIVDDIMLSRHLPKQNHSSYIRYMKLCSLMRKNIVALTLLDLLFDSQVNGKE